MKVEDFYDNMGDKVKDLPLFNDKNKFIDLVEKGVLNLSIPYFTYYLSYLKDNTFKIKAPFSFDQMNIVIYYLHGEGLNEEIKIIYESYKNAPYKAVHNIN